MSDSTPSDSASMESTTTAPSVLTTSSSSPPASADDEARSPSVITVHPSSPSPTSEFPSIPPAPTSSPTPSPSDSPFPPPSSPTPLPFPDIEQKDPTLSPITTTQGEPETTPITDSDEDVIPVSVKKYTWTPPTDADSVPYRPHQGEGSQYLRDFILGVNDGLISTFLVVVGVIGGNYTTLQALLVGISSAVAGAMSMGIGEYIATKSQLQVSEGEYKLESEHFKYHRDVELEQLRQFLTNVNLSGNLLEAVVSEVGRSDEGLMKMMQAFEFGGEEELERNPLKAMWMSGRLFFIGSLPTVIPFFATSLAPGTATGIAAALVGVSLFVVGAYKTRTTKGNWLLDGLENLGLGAIGTGIAYAVGVAFDKASGGNA